MRAFRAFVPLMVLVLVGCGGPAASPEPAPPQTSAGDGGVQTIDLGGQEAYGLAVHADSVWATTYQGGRLARVDPATNRVAAATTPAAGITSLLSTPDGLWVVGAGAVHRVDPATGQVAATVNAGGVCCDLSAGDGAIWAVDPGGAGSAGGAVLRIDPASIQVTARYPVTLDRNAHTNVVYAGGAAWVSSDTTPLYRVDPVIGTVTPFTVDGGVPFLARDGLVWGASPTRLWAVDERTGAVVKQIPLTRSSEVLSLGFGLGGIWVGIRHPGRVGAVLRLDPGTGAQVSEVDIDIPARIEVGFGSVWVTDSGSGSLYRITP